jgi:hypothetical protein
MKATSITTLPAHSPVRAILPLCLALLLMAVASPASQILRYREQTGDHSVIFSWQADHHPEGITVTQHQDNEIFRSDNTLDGTTLSWQYSRQPDTDVRVERHGDQLRFSGRLAGKAIDRSETIDGRPWYQPLSYCLQRMVARNKHDVTFWTIRPDTLEVLAMQAEHVGRDQLVAAGTAQPADRVVIRLDGVLAPLWQAEYWFRHGDSLFVHYRSTHGPPGSMETVINLLSP